MRDLFRFLNFSFILAVFMPSIAMAHHGFGLLFDVNDQVRIEGAVTEFKFKNPHSSIYLDVTNADGVVEQWHCEAQARSVLMRKGVKQSDIKVGDKIVLEGARGRKKSNECEVGTWVLADGSTRVMRSKKGRADVAVNTKPAPVAPEKQSVLGRWIRVTFTGMPVAEESFAAITEAGLKSNEGYSGFTDDPTLACRPANPVRAWSAPGQPTEIRWQDEKIVMQHEFMDYTRTIYMSEAQIPKDMQPDEMGVSIGKMDGDDLVVETRRFTDGVLLTHIGDSGLTHSSEMILHERFHVDSESGVMTYEWKAEDPLYYGKPFTGALELYGTELEIGRFDCVPQVAEAEQH